MITGIVYGQELNIVSQVIASETIDMLAAEFKFLTDEWNGLTKIAYFTQRDKTYAFQLIDDGITKDRGVNLLLGHWNVTVWGFDLEAECIDGSAIPRITTTVAQLRVEATGRTGDDVLPDVPMSIGEQILSTAEGARQIADQLREDAASGKFDGKSPYVGDNGDWYVYDRAADMFIDTGVYAGGLAPSIGDNGDWFIGQTDTGVKAQGPKGDPGRTPVKGVDYFDGYTPQKDVDYFDGEPGHSPVVTATKAGKVTTIDVDGSPIAEINDGADGMQAVHLYFDDTVEKIKDAGGNVLTYAEIRALTLTPNRQVTVNYSDFIYRLTGYDGGAMWFTNAYLFDGAEYSGRIIINDQNAVKFSELPNVHDVKVNGTSVVTHGVANISVPAVPTKVSELTNDSGYITAAKVNNPNLLDNPWFTVNQRGWTTGTGNAYTVDRWRNMSSGLTVTLDSLNRIVCSASAGPAFFRQTFAKPIPAGTVLTMSAIVTGAGSFRCGNASATDTGIGFDTATEQIFSKTFTAAMEELFFEFRFAAGQSATIKAVKFEYGSTSTLANDHEPDYAAELNKCRLYYERIAAEGSNLTISTAPAFSSDTIYFPITIAPKIAKPSLAGYANLRAGTAGFGVNGMSASAYAFSKDSGILTIEVRKTGAFAQGSIYRLGVAQGTAIELISADI